MNKRAVIRARIEPDLKEHAENVFRHLGVSTSQAIANKSPTRFPAVTHCQPTTPDQFV